MLDAGAVRALAHGRQEPAADRRGRGRRRASSAARSSAATRRTAARSRAASSTTARRTPRKILRKPSSEIESILGYVDEAELIHRDNLVLLGSELHAIAATATCGASNVQRALREPAAATIGFPAQMRRLDMHHAMPGRRRHARCPPRAGRVPCTPGLWALDDHRGARRGARIRVPGTLRQCVRSRTSTTTRARCRGRSGAMARCTNVRACATRSTTYDLACTNGVDADRAAAAGRWR